MGEVLPMPSFGDLFTDLRGEDRTLRISYHPDRGAVVLSLWSGSLCRGSFRMPADDLGRLLTLLTDMRSAAAPDATAGGDATGSAPTADETTAAVPAPSVERTGDVSAHRVALPIQPVPRVA
ncbi:hypothetical protein [Micromonospora sp. CB01531]|uniref:hypothetical protein n=1 Tax=Micromonospora sp. CB01531 TaxID=1718947 RepID=UPI00093DCF71|nr:hypothetical protein [Micromonospora sp. CB01531]OKI49029.1 hypothetical protein A6A27_35780 [Micromonospora sp. CB01531]